MDRQEIEELLSRDRPEVWAAVLRGIEAAYGTINAADDEHSGHVLEVITAVRDAVEPLV